MAPPRRLNTPLGNALRSTRDALSLSQKQLGRLVRVSGRVVARWENGERYPDDDQGERVFAALSASPAHLRLELAKQLGIELAPPTAQAPTAPPPDPRTLLDAVLFANAETCDVLPRHLRGFGVALLEEVDRLGLTAKDAAVLLSRKAIGAKEEPRS